MIEIEICSLTKYDFFSQVNIEEVYGMINKSLPPYACPVFMRVTRGELEKTSTYKFKKVKLREQAYDPAQCAGDQLFYFDGKIKNFSPLTGEVFASIQGRKIRF